MARSTTTRRRPGASSREAQRPSARPEDRHGGHPPRVRRVGARQRPAPARDVRLGARRPGRGDGLALPRPARHQAALSRAPRERRAPLRVRGPRPPRRRPRADAAPRLRRRGRELPRAGDGLRARELHRRDHRARPRYVPDRRLGRTRARFALLLAPPVRTGTDGVDPPGGRGGAPGADPSRGGELPPDLRRPARALPLRRRRLERRRHDRDRGELARRGPDAGHRLRPSGVRRARRLRRGRIRGAGTEHRNVLLTGEEMLRDISEVFDSMDQPTVDGFNTYFVSRAARRSGLTVALSGIGGDELAFGGYASFRDAPRAVAIAERAQRLTGEAPAAPGRRSRSSFRPPIGGRRALKLAEMLTRTPSLVSMYLLRRELFLASERRSLHPLPPGCNDESGVPEWELEDMVSLASKDDVANTISAFELSHYLRYMLLRDADVFSMSVGLELRVPLLDHRLVETAVPLPGRWKGNDGRAKPLLLDAVGPRLPGWVGAQRKRGFTFPWRAWLVGPLRDRAHAAVSNRDAWRTVGLDDTEPEQMWFRFLRDDARVSARRRSSRSGCSASTRSVIPSCRRDEGALSQPGRDPRRGRAELARSDRVALRRRADAPDRAHPGRRRAARRRGRAPRGRRSGLTACPERVARRETTRSADRSRSRGARRRSSPRAPSSRCTGRRSGERCGLSRRGSSTRTGSRPIFSPRSCLCATSPSSGTSTISSASAR